MKTLVEAIRYFEDEQACIDTVASMRWEDGEATCPKCNSKNVLWLKNQKRWKCREKGCDKQFSVKVGTIFEDSALPLDKWLVAMWLVGNCKNGISSYEVARDLGITQKSAWFMLHRIRVAMREQVFRYNTRKTHSNETRLAKVLSQVAGRRLTYKELTGKEGQTAF